jgi:hypothetical protein
MEFSIGVVDEHASTALVEDVEVILTVDSERYRGVKTVAMSIQAIIFRVNKVENVHSMGAGIGDEDPMAGVRRDGRR